MLLQGYGDILFVPERWFGGLILACTFLMPNAGLHGLFAGAAALAVLRAAEPAPPGSFFARIAVCNSILTGLYFGSQFAPGPAGALALFVAVLGVLALTGYLVNRDLPALSLPFSVAGSALFWWERSAGTLLHAAPAAMPAPYAAALSGSWLPACMGGIVLGPGALAGAAVLIALLVHSRLHFLLLGYGLILSAAGQGIFYSQLQRAGHYAVPFNLVLTAVALGGVFLSFSRASVLLATVGVLFAAALEGAFLSFFAYVPEFSPLTFPFCLTALLLLDLVKTWRPGWLAAVTGRNMETTADLQRSRLERFGEDAPVLGLPILQEAAVMQGVGGEWTHVGPWRFALDFNMLDEGGKPCRVDGGAAENYHVFGTQVCAPCDGEVVRAEHWHPDQKIGLLDLENNWGNHVMIRTAAGSHVLLAHLRQDSVVVRAGARVYEGQPIAAVGNSGHSYEPHLHLQVQAGPRLGGPAIPFRFKCYRSGRGAEFFSVPGQGAKVSPLPFNKTLPYALGLKLGQELRFDMEARGVRTKERLKVRLDERTGSWFFEDAGKGRLYFWSDARIFYVYDLQCAPDSPLNIMMAALPLLPLTYGGEYSWHDRLPLGVSYRGWRRLLFELLTPFFSALSRGRLAQYTLDETGMVLTGRALFLNEKVATRARLDPLAGLAELRAGEHVLTREGGDSPGLRGASAAAEQREHKEIKQ